MNNVLLTAGAIGAAYKVASFTGVVLTRGAELAAEKLFFSKFSDVTGTSSQNKINDKTEIVDDAYQNISDDEFGEVIKRHSPQFILMELDVEAKVKYARKLISKIKEMNKREMEGEEDGDDGKDESNDFIEICLENLGEICDKMIKNLHEEIYAKMDYHKTIYFSNYRKLDIKNELLLLRAQTKVFNSRMRSLIESLQVEKLLSQGENSFVPSHVLEKFSTVTLQSRTRENSSQKFEFECDSGEGTSVL